MRQHKRRLSRWRRLSQIIFFLLFVFLFIKTDYNGRDEIPYAVNLLFRIDPLLAVCASLAAKTVIVLMLPALVTIVLTIFLGRFFCGWFCPMGALLDICHPLFRSAPPRQAAEYRTLKYYLLVFLLVGSLFGISVAGYFDPFSTLVRGLALAVYPAFNALNTSLFTFTYQQAPDMVNAVTEPVYGVLKHTLLPFRQNYFGLAVFSLALLVTVLLLEHVERRFFCKNICPLGGMLAFIARFSLLRGHAGRKCGSCSSCQDVCRMGAIDPDRRISVMDCNLCMDCVDLCPGHKISFSFIRQAENKKAVGLSRRALLGAVSAAFFLPFVLKTRSLAARPDPYLIRPPGALPEGDFLARCVRCGECMKVCIGNALQPAFLTAGLEGMFSPRLKARTGYCEYNCTLCGQVCPTGAISRLTLPQKQAVKIGNASFDRNRCLPYAKGIPCIVCEEHCPTPDKAIKFRSASVLDNKGKKVEVRQPYLVDELCVGCGICEAKCPLPGKAAVRITSGGETRNPQNRLPVRSDTPGPGYLGPLEEDFQ
jgi:MauM/NapG family ferredoxin protein